MSKDPAFLFYSKDFYEGTRTMLPEERACYIDLLIYQHQNGGVIPDDLRRVLMYCNGCNEATLIATLEAKFEKNERGWQNKKLSEVMEMRSAFSKKQSMNGKVGQFFKKAKKILAGKEFKKLEQVFENETIEEIFEQIKDLEINEAKLIAMLEAKLKHLAIVIENKNEDLISFEKGGVGEKTFEDFRKIYPGTKGGFKTEFENFKKKAKKFEEILPLLIPAVEAQIEYRKKCEAAGKFYPEWKHLKTWINNRCWEDELPEIKPTEGKFQNGTNQDQLRINSGVLDVADEHNRRGMEKLGMIPKTANA